MTLRQSRHRHVRLGSLTAAIEWRSDGSAYITADQALEPYPCRATDRFCHWAATVPERDFLRWREDGTIGHLTYGDAFTAMTRIGQSLLGRGVSAERPVVILSGNTVEHALLMLAAMHIGGCCVSLSPAYSLLSRDFAVLKQVLSRIEPALVFAYRGPLFEAAICTAVPVGVDVVVGDERLASRPSTAFSEMLALEPTNDVDIAHQAIAPETIAKILFTSGSTGEPKGVINTHRMLTSNQQMIAQVFPFLADAPPVLVDWLPWHHTFGGNHNLGLVAHHGGTLFIDEGKPMPGAFNATVRNLREMAPTIYLNVPRGYEELVRALRADAELSCTFFSRLQILFYAAASLPQHLADELDAIAFETCGERIVMVAGFGATETAPLAIVRNWPSSVGGSIGLPVPGMHAKVAPCQEKLELRVRGPNVTPGYWRDLRLTEAAFDDEGFYRLGDAVRFVDASDVNKGLTFDGRVAEDFKLATGTWVHVGALRSRVIAHFAPYLREAVFTGHDRNELGMLIVADIDACRSLTSGRAAAMDAEAVVHDPDVQERFRSLLKEFAAQSTGSANRICRAILLVDPPSLDAGEITDKGTLNQRAVLSRRASVVEMLYAARPAPSVLQVEQD